MNTDWERVRHVVRQFAQDVQRERDGHGRDWSTQNRYDGGAERGGSYNGGGEHWNRDYGYSPQNATMGFHNHQPREYGQKQQGGSHYETHEHREQEPFHKQMERYFREVKEGRVDPPAEMCEMLALVAGECMGGGSRHGSHHGHDEVEHERYKDAIERLREAPANEKQRLMKELFEDDLSPDEQTVLRVMSEQKSYKKLSQERGMSLERFKEAKKSLKHRLK